MELGYYGKLAIRGSHVLGSPWNHPWSFWINIGSSWMANRSFSMKTSPQNHGRCSPQISVIKSHPVTWTMKYCLVNSGILIIGLWNNPLHHRVGKKTSFRGPRVPETIIAGCCMIAAGPRFRIGMGFAQFHSSWNRLLWDACLGDGLQYQLLGGIFGVWRDFFFWGGKDGVFIWNWN